MGIKLASDITFDSIVDGPGMRAVVWTQGCIHKCRGCHNPETHNLSGGFYMEIDEIIDKIKSRKLQSGVTISGGDPLVQLEETEELVRKLKEEGYNIWLYTGYKYEELVSKSNKNYFFNISILNNIDVLVDGKYDETKRDISLLFRGSSNQRVIDVKKSMLSGKVVIKEEYDNGYVDKTLPMAK